MVKRTPMDSGTRVRGWMWNGFVGFATLAILLVLAPRLLHVLGPVVVVAGPFLSAGLLTVRLVARGRTLRALLLGASAGFVLIFVYGFSPPVLERIGHAIGWPGTTLRLWERFTAPVYDYCCPTLWFWRIFELWDILTVMIVDHLDGSMASLLILPVILLAAFALGLVYLRRARQRAGASNDGEGQASSGLAM